MENYRRYFANFFDETPETEIQYQQFDDHLGLKYIHNEEPDIFEFKIQDKNKWFLAKIKYGF